MLRRFTRKRAVVALTIVAVLAVAGGALAYFSSSGSGTGQASVGKSTALTVNVSSDSSGSLYPGSGTETLTYTVKNPSSGAQNLSATSTSVASLNGDITQGGVELTGCKVSWFTATNTAPTPLPQNLAGGATSTAGSVAVAMIDSGTNQDVCQNAKPDISVSAS
jgi:hypothetical protein